MRQKFLDTAKALCIILVVVGHFNPSASPGWWGTLFRVIYSFHMPLFMFVSGLLYSLTYKDRGYLPFIKGKLRRLALPYLLSSVAIISIKMAMQSILPVRNAVGSDAFLTMFWSPSAAVHLWFLWTLMSIFLIVPIFRTRKSRLVLLAAALVLHFAPVQFPGIFCLDKFKEMLVYFVAGMLFCDYGGLELFRSESGAYRLSPAVLLPLFVLLEWMAMNSLLRPLPSFLASFTGIALVLILSRFLASRNIGWLTVLEANVFFIYLTHSIFVEGVKGVLAVAGLRPDSHFVLCLLLCTLAGVLGPIIVRESFLRVRVLLKEKVAGREQ